MTISDVCKFELKANIDRVQKENQISRRRAVALVADEIGLIEETARKADLRARQELGQIVPKRPAKEWPKCKKCGTEEVTPASLNRPKKDRLCSRCRQQYAITEIEEAQKAFDAVPVDAESEAFWSTFVANFRQRIDHQYDNGGVSCGKVSEETLKALMGITEELNEFTGEVLKESQRPGGG